jgi:AcrR family transcriptional regulator
VNIVNFCVMPQDGGMTHTSTSRTGYHHGDLANALADAATEMASEGGPEAVVLREAARRTGVSAAAAYRHFADHGDLLQAVKGRAVEALAAAMLAGLESGSPLPDQADEAIRRFRILGAAYIDFALADPGLFRTAFCRPAKAPAKTPAEIATGIGSSRPFLMLASVLDELVDCGLLAPDRRPLAEIAAWSAVHGLATLLLDGPLAWLSDQDRQGAIQRTLDVVMRGIAAPAPG